MLNVKIKKLHPDAVIPFYSKKGDCGMDLTATSVSADDDGNYVYGTGLACEIPLGYVGLLFPRSSNSKKAMLLSNSIGVIDSGYRGEIILKFKPSLVCPSKTSKNGIYEVGERVGQIIIIPYPEIQFEEVSELSETERGDGGFGSTGK